MARSPSAVNHLKVPFLSATRGNERLEAQSHQPRPKVTKKNAFFFSFFLKWSVEISLLNCVLLSSRHRERGAPDKEPH